ncbi:MAG: glutamate synthase subunit alpha [Actinobacteria bacterium 69-20]|nr:glutamate synthase large subunit [Actinomycetota bacterium]OJV23289.1 MAG: glutamate synthase subunit alpha [Actinobacteria bacterium 69-20]
MTTPSPRPAAPGRLGLYDSSFEHDACGVAAIVDVHGRRSHAVIADAMTALVNLAHRGAAGSDPCVGDGAGILLQIPDELFRAVCPFDLPVRDESGDPGQAYAAGLAFLPADGAERARAKAMIRDIVTDEDLDLIGWRAVPTDPVGSGIGQAALDVMPAIEQLFLAAPGPADGSPGPDAAPTRSAARPQGLALDRRVYAARKRIEHDTAAAGCAVYFPSLSARTIIYKGMFTTDQLAPFYPDLTDDRTTSAIAVVHSRFSTNTFPAWPLAHPFRYIAHNGEINTIRGNRNRMRARESLLETDLIPGDLARAFPICTPDASDSATFDEVLELLHLAGRSLPHAVLMMIPEAWQSKGDVHDDVRGFAEFHASLIEPWDGPACVTFTDGTLLGAVLDRNGLRPGRWWLTAEGRVILASESGVLPIPPSSVVRRGRLAPGRMFLVDTAAGRIVPDEEIKSELARAHAYRDWVQAGLLRLADLPGRPHAAPSHLDVRHRQQLFGYTEEDLRVLVGPMAQSGAEAIGSMGDDTPRAALSERPRMLFDYFSQLFAQVTNPPLDAVREKVVTSMASVIGPEQNLLAATPASCRQIWLPTPILGNADVAKLVRINDDGDLPAYAAAVISGRYRVAGGGAALAAAIERARAEVDEAIACGAGIIVLTDRDADADHAPIPSLLLTSAVHQHLVRTKARTKVALVVEAGDAREVHHMALLLGYGAGAVNPYLALETAADLATAGMLGEVDATTAEHNMLHGWTKGVLKVMSKMGISTVGSYRCAQAFACFGLDQAVLDEYFTGTVTRTGGTGIDRIATDAAARHALAFTPNPTALEHRGLEVGGQYQWRREGERHLFNPETVYLLQHSTRTKQESVFRRYTDEVEEGYRRGGTLRGLLELRTGVRRAVPLDEVEPASEIVKRFATGAMSYGSISAEAHETLAMAMNKLGGKSNTGEGGEDVERLLDPLRRSYIKQVASGRFGVTSAYLVNAGEIQIKMAQGAKPGEGGQLPGHKVYPWIAATRHATPGVGLISPPPHHDIYSIEDLKQLIYDLRCANPAAQISVKLVSEPGVGTVAAGVTKAHADIVVVAGHDGGTGAAPLTSLKHAGQPWELGLAEVQQTLRLNRLRTQVRVQVDGGLKTGRDVVIAALLGAEEFGFATAPLVVAGCVMMRVCHLDTCPVGIATQNPLLRKRFPGAPEFVETFFLFLAEQAREHLAALGFRSIDEAVGHAELLDVSAAVADGRARGVDLAPLLAVANVAVGLRCTTRPKHDLSGTLDALLIEKAMPALTSGAVPTNNAVVAIDAEVHGTDRATGTMLGSEVTRRCGPDGLPDGTIDIRLIGTAGQSLGAFLPRGIDITLTGDANDYVGKGLSGGTVVVRPHPEAPAGGDGQVIAGNTIGYGATSGTLYLRGTVGERFAVRNSGALLVCEGTGDHALEYMTGGRVIVLGRTGRNVAAGMSGGLAFLLDAAPALVNPDMVELSGPDDDDTNWLETTLYDYATRTESPLARSLLKDWPTAAARFTRILPQDYARVLWVRRRAEIDGLTDAETDALIMEKSHG